MPWGFAAVAAGAIGSSLISGSAATSAADTQAAATNQASANQLAMFSQTQQNLSPYLGVGTNALGVLGNQLGLGPNGTGTPAANSQLALPTYGSTINGLVSPTAYNASMYQQSPGYQFELSQGLGAISNAASAQGGIQSGNTLKALTAYGTGLANQDYQQAYQNYLTNYNNAYNSASNNSNTAFNRLQTLAGSGQNAAANLGALSSQTASQVGSNTISAGNATAAGTVGAANAATGGINSLAQLAFLYQQNPSLFSSGTSGTSGTSGALSASSLNPGGYGG